MSKVLVDAYQCERCKYVWIVVPKIAPSLRCPKCKSPYWNTPRKTKPSKPAKKDRRITIRADGPLRVSSGPASPSSKEVSRHCKLGAHGGCKDPACGCSCH